MSNLESYLFQNTFSDGPTTVAFILDSGPVTVEHFVRPRPGIGEVHGIVDEVVLSMVGENQSTVRGGSPGRQSGMQQVVRGVIDGVGQPAPRGVDLDHSLVEGAVIRLAIRLWL